MPILSPIYAHTNFNPYELYNILKFSFVDNTTKL